MSTNNSNKPTYSTSVIQINLGKRFTATSTLHKELKTNQICLIQEPVVRKGTIGNVPRSHRQFVPYTKDKPRVAALLPKDLGRKTMVLSGLSSGDNITLRCSINKDLSIILTSIYMDITKDIPSDLITRIASYAERERLPLIASVDSNAHHTAWGHHSTNARGRSLLQSISSNNLAICNTGNTPTFVGKLGHSVIDLTLCNQLALNIIRDWKVDKGKSLSDHEAISFKLGLGDRVSFATRSSSKCDWELYNQLVATELDRHPFWFSSVSTATDLNSRQLFLSDILRRSFDSACPITRGTLRSSVPWWTAELTTAKQTSKALRRKANRTRNNQNWELSREANRTYNKLLTQAKRTNWKQFCDNLKGTSTLARVHKILSFNKPSQGNLNSVRKPDGTLTDSPQETLTVLSDTLIPSDGLVIDQPPYHGGDPQTIIQITAPNRVDRAVRELQLKKAAGPDQIRNEMIINAWDLIKDPVRMIFHNSLALGITPDSWHQTTGCIIPKPLKPDYTNPRAFRIISLTSSFQKLLERLILWHLELDLNIPATLTKNQHGFRKGKSTESAIHLLTRRIEDAMATGHYALGVFLDIEQAFDAVSFTAIRAAMLEANIPITVTQWIFFMISNRYITLSYCDFSVTKKATKGSPQGGVLSPLLWNLTLNTFLSRLGIHSNFVQAFADDLVILIRGICKTTIKDIAQQQLTNISSWCTSKGLKLSGVKSTAILFTTKRDNTLDSPLTVDGTTVPTVNSTVYLGVTFDQKLNWSNHILKKCDKAVGQLHACKQAVGKIWGISPSGLRWIFNQVIIPSLGYAAVVWQHSTDRNYITVRLETVQRQAALMITRGLKSTPTPNLEIMASLQPISIKLKYLAIKSALRLKLQGAWNKQYHFNQSGSCKSHAHNAEKMIANITFTGCTLLDNIPRVTMLDRRYKVIIQHRKTAISYIEEIPPNIWQIFTDGSKAGSNTGAGFCVIKDTQEYHRVSYQLGKLATVYQCELFALHMASIWINENLGTSSTINLFSDSQASLQALTSTSISSRLVLDIADQLNTLGTSHKVELRWVPGHEGVHGNELADELAREGSSCTPIGPEPFLPLSEGIINTHIKDYLFNLHIKKYKQVALSDKGKTPLTIFLNKYRYKKINISGTHTRWLTWLLTGHSPLAYFQTVANNDKFETQDCEHCPGEAETSQHFLCECIQLMTTRMRIFGKPILTMEELSNSKLDHITKFVEQSARFDRDDLFG